MGCLRLTYHNEHFSDSSSVLLRSINCLRVCAATQESPAEIDFIHNEINEPPAWLRGYTGHSQSRYMFSRFSKNRSKTIIGEHLVQFDLVNMNGRMYDPKLGRMLRPDNFVQDPTSTQSYNRYAYVWNNPLKYTDPSGEVAIATGMIIGAVVGAYIGGSVANNSFNPAEWEMDGNTLNGMVIGGMVGMMIGANVAAVSLKMYGTIPSKLLASSNLKSGLLSGGLNAMYNYESGQNFLTTLGYFGSGFLGGSLAGVGNISYLGGMAIGGTSNALLHGAVNSWDVDTREYAQKFVSGALSVYSGLSAFGDVSYMYGADGNYFGGNKMVAKAWRAGWTNQASDFAHSSKDAFNGRSFTERFFMFGFAAGTSMIGSAGEDIINGPKLRSQPFKRAVLKGSRQLAYGYADYHMQQVVHSMYRDDNKYMPWQYKYRNTKFAITGYKALFYGLQTK
jgi:RHS repeat-associated protein